MNKQLGLYVWRSGLAEVADLNDTHFAKGAICVATGNLEQLKGCLVTCRLMKDGTGRYLVNGIPEANNEQEAGHAIEIFKLICANRLDPNKKAFDGVVELRAKLEGVDDLFDRSNGCLNEGRGV